MVGLDPVARATAAEQIEGRMQELRVQLDSLQLQLGSLSSDIPACDAGDEEADSMLPVIDVAHRAAVQDAGQQRRRIAAPGPGARSDEHAGAAPVEMQDFFRRNGYWVVPNAVSGEALSRLQSAWLRESAPARASWEAEKAKGTGPNKMGFAAGTWVARTYFDLPRFAEADPSFLDLLDNRKVLPLIKAVMGGKVVLDQIQGRTVPPGPGINEDGALSNASFCDTN
eukprot:SAG11_NODE_1324_length_5199_cov_5.524902_3_plen_226_part_00